MVSFTALGKYKVSGAITDQNVVEYVQTWIANPVLGDMLYEQRYTQYQDFGGVKFPGDIHTHQGDQRLDEGHNSFQLTVKDVRANPGCVHPRSRERATGARAAPGRRPSRRRWPRASGTSAVPEPTAWPSSSGTTWPSSSLRPTSSGQSP